MGWLRPQAEVDMNDVELTRKVQVASVATFDKLLDHKSIFGHLRLLVPIAKADL